MSEFSEQKSHEENMKISIDKILGSNVELKRAKRTADEQKKTLFVTIIDNLVAIDIRQTELHRSYFLDLVTYNSPFFLVIESLFKLHFNKAQCDMIYFYLYDRITPEGFYVQLTDENDQEIDLSNAEKLWEELKKIK